MAASPQPSMQPPEGGSGRAKNLSQAGVWRPGTQESFSLSSLLRESALSHRQGWGGRFSTWMTTKRWGSLAMRENSATNSRNLGRHSESIIQPGGWARAWHLSSGCSLHPVSHTPTPSLDNTRVQSPLVIENL